jgi:hypothetical protein
MRVNSILSILVILSIVGCAGRRPDEASSVDLTVSNPISSNVNLNPITVGSNFQRVTTSPLLISVTESPGPTGLTSRIVRLNVTDPATGSEYALVNGGTTYVELTENAGTTVNVWRSQGGKLALGQNDSKASILKLTDVEMTPFSGGAVGNFRMNGTVAVRF